MIREVLLFDTAKIIFRQIKLWQFFEEMIRHYKSKVDNFWFRF